SFAWQHWSHTFEYALVAGAGDWRDAGFTVAGQEYNHDLLTCETAVHRGPLPAATSLCGVTGRPGAPAAVLTALKPRGNPLASGRPGQPRREDGVTVRLRDAGRWGGPGGTGADGAEPDSTGQDSAGQDGAAPATSRVRLFTGLGAARLTSLLEDADGPPLPLVDGAAEVAVPVAGMVTLALAGLREDKHAEDGPAGAGPAGAGPDGPPPEPAQPVFSRYWLHGKGPAPAGNVPVAVHLSPGRIALGAAGPVSALRLTVACGPVPARGQVTLDVPPGLVVEPGGGGAGPLRYELAGGAYAGWDLTARARPGTAPGRYYVAARIGDDLGQSLEDAVLVTVGEPPAPPLDLPLEELLPLIEADERAAAAEIGLRLQPATLRIPPGRAGEFAVEVANRTAAPIRGECQLISPLGTWPALGPWTRGFSAAPGEAATLCYPLRLPAGARPGSHWWALAKVMYFGRIAYSECARIEACD
ncbi:MAG TPA: hypothetical protein VEC76_02925, partial [Streptosporangiaceae bacterium]|nr:hypothetical protein [Streptosporangiaceae bacterium]